MTQKEKQLLLITLCGMLPYGVKVKYIFDDGSHCPFELSTKILQECLDKGFLPYLRPMSSMMEKERKYYNAIVQLVQDGEVYEYEVVDWLNAHHFDFRGLIPLSLALEAPEGMYKTE